LAEKQHLFLVPHGVLHYLPLHALAPTGQLVRDTATTVSYAPSASVLLKTGLAKQAKKAVGQCLAIGVNLDGLEHAEAEAKWIAVQLSGQALLGEAATLATVRAALGTANIIHFACHGRFRRTTPMNSALVLADGELTAADILQTVRFDADIVTLSACDTGLNYLAYGDELLGMVRACLCVGARALLVTLWQVHDIPTRLFMERFYRVWRTGASRAGALVEAQRYLRTLDIEQLRMHLTDYRLASDQIEVLMTMFTAMLPGSNPFDHPYYWGAFLLIGDPR
jgi:CHAT domain-containing protein